MKNGKRNDDIEERLVEFAVTICNVVNKLPSNRVGNHISGQLIRCGTSPAPNYGEAQSAESRKDFIHNMKLSLKELRETNVWLKWIERLRLIELSELSPAQTEVNELIAIFVRSIATAQKNLKK